MKAEIIAVGSELLLGQIANTNAQFISARLSEIGVDVYYHTVVGDNPKRLLDAVRIAERRADILIFTGGLGPTKDDMTKETIAQHLQVNLHHHETALAHIEQYFARQRRTMTANNAKQALVFEGSTVLQNYTGMAPGMALTRSDVTYMLLPGPPHEMKPMFERDAIPYIMQYDVDHQIIVSRVLNCFGIGEAELETKIESILDAQTNPTIAPLASPKGVTLRLTAKANSEEEAYALIAPVEANIRERIGTYIYGVDDETLSSKLAHLLLQHEETIAAAESLTAGMFTAELARHAGISRSLAGGVVVYSLEQKVRQLGLNEEALRQHGVVSSYCAEEMARAVAQQFGSTIGIGLTGAAGPDAHDGAPAGTIWIGIYYAGAVQSRQLHLSGMRNTNRERAMRHAYFELIRLLEHSS